MENQDNSIHDDHENDVSEQTISTMAKAIEGDTYPISDNESIGDETFIIDTNGIQDRDQGELDQAMSQDSLSNDEQDLDDRNQQTTSSIVLASSRMTDRSKSTTNSARSVNLDEHIKLVKQKKEEAEVQRLQRFQEQLRKKEEKWQQQQLNRVKRWLQLRNRDTHHRSQVEERRKKREEETKVKIEETLRRGKEREQKTTNSYTTIHSKGNGVQRPDSLMTSSVDVISTRRAVSAPRLRSHHRDMTNLQRSNDSPITSAFQDAADHSTSVISSHQLNTIAERRSHHRSRHSYEDALNNTDRSLSGTPHSMATSRARPMPTSYAYWLNTGDNNNHSNARFMRSTYAATCRSRLSRSVERCPRACRAHEEASNTTLNITAPNGETPRRGQSVNRQHLQETIVRLSKPKTIPTSLSNHSGTPTPPPPLITSSSIITSTSTSTTTKTNGLPSSQSSHQIRISTAPATTNHHSTSMTTSTIVSSKNRRSTPSRPATTPPHQDAPASSVRVSTAPERAQTPSTTRLSSHRTNVNPKSILPSPSKPPTSSSSSRSKPAVQRPTISTSLSTSVIATSSTTKTTTNKQNIRRTNEVPPPSSTSQPKSSIDQTPSVITSDSQILINDTEQKSVPVNENTPEKDDDKMVTKVETVMSSAEPTEDDTASEIPNSTNTTTAISKREQAILDEQEYQRKLAQKIREAQQRKEQERQREEELKRQAELEEYELEQKQIRLLEEQRLAEQERLERAIQEREREEELKRQEELRAQQQREQLERKQAEEAERLNRERLEKIRKEEEERVERKRRLDLIMRRTRQTSPSPKPDTNNSSKTNIDETNQDNQQQPSLSHSISDNRFPTSLSNDNFLNNGDATVTETSKFKSSLIQSVLNKARNTNSADNLIQSNMTISQIMNESIVDSDPTTTTATIVTKSIPSTNQSDTSDDDDDDQQDSGINNTTNGHSDSLLSSSPNLDNSHDRPIETATIVH